MVFSPAKVSLLSSAKFSKIFSPLLLVILFDLSLSQPTAVEHKSIEELLDGQSLLPSVEKHDFLVEPFQQQNWLTARPFQEYRRAPQTDELGLLLQYFDNKRNAPSLLTEENEGGRHSISGSPLGTMRFGKRKSSSSPLGTMRFGKREYSKSPFGTMRFG